jgi:hypothetical protein
MSTCAFGARSAECCSNGHRHRIGQPKIKTSRRVGCRTDGVLKWCLNRRWLFGIYVGLMCVMARPPVVIGKSPRAGSDCLTDRDPLSMSRGPARPLPSVEWGRGSAMLSILMIGLLRTAHAGVGNLPRLASSGCGRPGVSCGVARPSRKFPQHRRR